MGAARRQCEVLGAGKESEPHSRGLGIIFLKKRFLKESEPLSIGLGIIFIKELRYL